MDAYTARCLQVSTNISDGIPQRRRSEMMKRQNSSYDARPAPARPVHSRAKTSVGGLWPLQTDQSQMPQYSAAHTPMSAQPFNFSTPPSAAPSYASSFQAVPYMTPITPYTPSDWHASAGMDTKQLQGLGMDFSSSDFAINSTEPNDDIIHLNSEWAMNGAQSPDRRSSSSVSEITDLTESTAGHSRQSSAAFESVHDRDMRRSRSLHRHSRSLSRSAASRAASKRAHRRQLSCQPIPHGRNPSANGFMPTLPQTPALPDPQTASLAMEFDQNSFMNVGFPEENMPMEADFQNSFGAMMDLPMVVPQATLSNDNMMASPPSEGMYWDTTIEQGVFLPEQHQVQQTIEHQHHNGCCGSEDPEKPDLFESLREEASNPPEEDMHPEDPDMVPQEQEPRFEGDLYTPRWVRGQGNKREGYCGLCKPGRWLVLKNSAYWYDKSFTHGISAATGQPFEGPRETRRMAGNPDVWEGLCGGCNDWIALISSKKKGTTWFRHAYKCHGKNKDGANKKGRQTSPLVQQPMPFANMKPVPMTDMSHHAAPMFYQPPQPELYHMHTMPHHPGMDMKDNPSFADIVYH